MQNFILSKSTFHWFQWISNEFLWMNFHQKSVILTQSGFGSGSHVQLTKYWNHVCIENRPNIPKLRLNKNNATYERIWIRFWSVFGPFLGEAICIINDILSNKTTKCLIQTISVMFNRIYSLKFQKSKILKFNLNNKKDALKTCISRSVIFEKKCPKYF